MSLKKTSLTKPTSVALFVLLLWGSIFLSYSNSFTIAFQFDDTHTVQSNLAVRSLKNIPRFFIDANTSSYRPENSGYRPMTTTALAFGFALSGMETWGYHLIKIIEQCIAATLLFLVALKLLPRFSNWTALPTLRLSTVWFFASWFIALIFGVHRANTETVNYICAVSTLQAGLFYVASFYFYLLNDSKKSLGKQAPAFLILSVVCYFLGNLSKEEAITLPAMLFLYEWYFNQPTAANIREKLKKSFWPCLKPTLPYFGAALLYLYLRVMIPDAVADSSRGNVPTFVYFITQFRSWLYYWKLFFWPMTMNADNLSFGFSTEITDPRVIISFFIHLCIWITAFLLRIKRPLYSFGILWLYITVAPASSVFRLVEAVNDHRMYIPYLFLSLISVSIVFEGFFYLCKKLPAKKVFALVLTLLSFTSLALGYGTYEQNKVWQTDVSLWEDVLEKNPESIRAMNVLGISLLNRGETERAVALLENCFRQTPGYLPCIVHLSMAYANKKDYARGLEVLNYGYSVDPNYIHLNYHLGVYYKEYFGLFENARPHFLKVIERTGGRFFQAWVKLAEMDLEDGRVDEALKLVQKMISLDSSAAEGWEVYAKCLMMKANFKDATGILKKLISVAPTNFKFHLALAGVHERAGLLEEARAEYETTLDLYFTAIQAWQGLERVANRLKLSDKAIIAREKIEQLKKRRTWHYAPSMLLPGEKARATGP